MKFYKLKDRLRIEKMRNFLICCFAMIVVGCASDPSHRANIINEELSQLTPPSQSLSKFSNFELARMEMLPAITNNPGKAEVAAQLESKLRAKLIPLLERWESSGNGSGTLVIKPKVVALRIVSGGARFWAGAWAGESAIEMDLELIDKATNSRVANARINRHSSAMSGAWSVGSTDRNLLDYMVDISVQYLTNSY